MSVHIAFVAVSKCEHDRAIAAPCFTVVMTRLSHEFFSETLHSACKQAEKLWFGQQSLGAQVSPPWGQTKALLTECEEGNATMLTFKVGACATPAAGKAMAEYYLSATLQADPGAVAAAYYYTGAEATQEGATSSHRAMRHIAEGGTAAELRRDISPELATRLGITEPERPLTQDGIANLLNARRLDGNAIAGRKKHSPTRSIAEVFALDPKHPPTAEAIRNVLAGKRADGGTPQTASGNALPAETVEGARKRFKDAIGLPTHREASPEELAHLANGKLATGRFIDAADYRRQIHATRPPIGFFDMTFSADKSLSVAWALAPTEAERAALLDIHQRAVAETMTYVETQLGFARKGQGGKDGVEPGELGWISFQHYTARPAADIERRDKEGRAYTDIREVPLQTADPQLHTHVTVFNSVLTASGRIGAIDVDRLNGLVKEFGAVYQANVAERARRLGIETVLDQRTGAARLADIPHSVRELFSKRHTEAEHAARDFAARKGVNWDGITAEQKIALLKAGAAETRQAKEPAIGVKQKSDFVEWREQAAAAAYRHRSVLRPDAITPAAADGTAAHAAYRVALPILKDELARRAVLDGQDLREIAARSLIVAGIGQQPGDDIDAVVKPFASAASCRTDNGPADLGQRRLGARQGTMDRHHRAACRAGTRADPARQDGRG